MSEKRKGYYVMSKSKTGKKPRTGIRFKGQYLRIPASEERVFVLVGVRMSGKVDTRVFNSVQAAMKVGWTKVA